MRTLHGTLLILALLLPGAGCAAETSPAESDATNPMNPDTDPVVGPQGDPVGEVEDDTKTPEGSGSDAAQSVDGPLDASPVDESGDSSAREEQSGWPTNPSKEDIADPGWDSVPGVGTVIPNFQAIDQYGEEVELYDFAGQGVPIVIDVGTWFCDPCMALASYLSDGDVTPLHEFGWWKDEYEVVLELVNNGDLIWITVLYSLGDPVTAEDVFLWHEEWPNPHIPILADTTLQLQEYLQVSAMPRLDVLNEDMIFEVFETGGPATGMKYISALP